MFPIKIAQEVFRETTEILKKSGEIRSEFGHVTSILGMSLGILCLLGVIAFHFPEYLTTPELRQEYSVEFLRQILFYTLIVSGGFAISNILLNKERPINIFTISIVTIAVILGGSAVPI
jgi:Na+-driven multidrug efflux pump